MERRLAAIFAADVVGYSRLMEMNEAETLVALKDLRRNILLPLVQQYHGRVVKMMGDGVLVEFASAVNATLCGAALQEKLAAANAGRAEAWQIVLRIGINLGDVMIDGKDLYGDGVNIAARLEALAAPGEILIAGAVHDQVRNKVGLTFDDLGPQSLKNLSQPVHVYRVVPTGQDGLPVQRPADRRPGATAVSARPVIAVLPFSAEGSDIAQVIGDGIGEDVITALSHFPQLTVLSHRQTTLYRGLIADPRRLRQEHGIGYLLEGSLRKLGSRLRITTHLIETASGNQIWAEHFDCRPEEIFDIQDHIVGIIVGTLVGRVQMAVVNRSRSKAPCNLEAYECVLRCKTLPVGDPAMVAELRRLAERAIELDPTYGRAYIWLSYAIYLEWFRDLGSDNALLERALDAAKQSVVLAEYDGDCHDALGWIYLHLKSFDLATQCKLRALELNPGNPEQHVYLAVLHAYLGNVTEATTLFERARELDPYYEPSWYWHMRGVTYFVAGQYDDAIKAMSRSATMPIWVRAYLAACEALSGRVELARTWLESILRDRPDFSATALVAKEPYRRQSDSERLRQAMLAAGLPQ